MVNWLTNFVLPKIRAAVSKKDDTDNLWQKCPACEHMLFHRELEASLHVCRNCGHHLRIGAVERLRIMFDDGVFSRIELPKTVADPLHFRDRRRYTDRLKEAQTTYEPGGDAVVVAHGRIGGRPAVVAAFEFGFMGGSMGLAAGEALLAAAKLAVLQEAALIAVPASGGARMQEGVLSLMQMPRTIIAAEMVKEAGLPYIVLLTDPTTGGVSASFAMVGDITLAEPGAVIGFAGARVIEETIHEKLPDGFQRAEYLLDHGMVDMVVPRGELRATIGRLLGLLREPQRTEIVAPTPRGRMSVSASDIVLARLTRLHPKLIDLSFDRIERLLAALGDPHENLPPVIHVAGTNGKGSTVATLRACLEAGGYRVHVYISPHLVRFHERIRLAGKLIEEDALIDTARRMRARQSRGADHLFRDHHRGGVSRLRPHPGRHRAARNRAWRPARRDQRDPPPGGDRDHPDIARPSGLSRRHDCRDRRRKGRHPEDRFAGDHRPAAIRGGFCHRGPRRGG